MKNVILAIATTLFLSACSSNQKKSNSDVQHTMYACPMHSEVVGNKGDKCYKCGMELSVPVNSHEDMNMDMDNK